MLGRESEPSELKGKSQSHWQQHTHLWKRPEKRLSLLSWYPAAAWGVGWWPARFLSLLWLYYIFKACGMNPLSGDIYDDLKLIILGLKANTWQQVQFLLLGLPLCTVVSHQQLIYTSIRDVPWASAMFQSLCLTHIIWLNFNCTCCSHFNDEATKAHYQGSLGTNILASIWSLPSHFRTHDFENIHFLKIFKIGLAKNCNVCLKKKTLFSYCHW